jgi:hypothetical protein
MRRLSTVAAFVGVISSVAWMTGPGRALANNDPHRVPVGNQSGDVPAGVCSFPVHIEVVSDNEYATITTLPDQTVVIKQTGKLKVVVTNLTNHRSVPVNAGGPGTIRLPAAGGFTLDAGGHWLIINLASDAAAFGLPPLMLTSGNLHESFDSNGVLTALSVSGHVTDLCAALA